MWMKKVSGEGQKRGEGIVMTIDMSQVGISEEVSRDIVKWKCRNRVINTKNLERK